MSIVMKFGGTSVADSSAINQAVNIIEARIRSKPVVVTSALADVTNLLLDTVRSAAANNRSKMLRHIAVIEKKHMAVAAGFSAGLAEEVIGLISEHIGELRSILDKKSNFQRRMPGMNDLAASFGERLSSWLLYGALMNRGIKAARIDSREIIVTNDDFGSAEVDMELTRKNFAKHISPLIKKGVVPVITGFIGRSFSGKTTTLGRGGSDYSAAIAAVSLDADEIQIWKDIRGFMTADPRIVGDARIIPRLSFQEAAELAYFGAKLIHPKTIHPAVRKNIPVRILNTFDPQGRGTLILGRAAGPPVRAIAYKKGITVINITSLRMLGPYGFLATLFGFFARHRVPVDVVATSEVSVSMTIEDSMLNERLIRDLETIGTVNVRKNQAIVSLVGRGLRDNINIEADILKTLRSLRIHTSMISKGASSINFTFIIKRLHCDKAVRKLHFEFFN